MFSTLFSITLFLAFVLKVVLADFPITEPTFTQCQDAQITWQKTKGPYNVIVVPSNDMCGNPIADLGDHTGNQITWHKVPLIAGSRVVVSVEDSTGDEAWTGTITVLPSEDTSCLPANERANATASDAAAFGVASSTLVVPPSQTSGAKAAGAANAGLNPLSSSAQHSMSKISLPALWITALFALLSLSL
jgi:hypothetical protein